MIDGNGTAYSYAIKTDSYADRTVISNCYIKNWWYNIYINDNNYFFNVTNNTVTEGDITNGDGIYLNYAFNGSITNNRFNYTFAGITVGGNSKYNNISDNIITKQKRGIYLLQSWYNNIFRNNISDEDSSPQGCFYFLNSNSIRGNVIFNNLCNGTPSGSANWNTVEPNYFNTTQQSGSRIFSDGTDMGGNYWTNSTSTGYSDTCTDADCDGFCDSPLNLTNMVACSGASCGNNTDWLPYSDEYVEGEPPVCDSDHCDLCQTEGDCETATCYWWGDSTCHDTEEPPPAANCWTNTTGRLTIPPACRMEIEPGRLFRI